MTTTQPIGGKKESAPATRKRAAPCWLSIWLRPRRTIRQIVDQDPKRFVIALAVSTGALNRLMQWTGPAAGSGLPLWLTGATALAIGALTGWIGLYLFGWLYRWVGSWMGGRATGAEVRAAIAWVEIPTFVVFAIWILVTLLSPASVGAAAPPAAGGAAVTAALGILFGVVSLVGWVWSIVLACNTLAEVHGFSAWKGLGTLIIPNALLILPLFLAGALGALFLPSFAGGRLRAPGAPVTAQQVGRPAEQPNPLLPEEPLLPAPTHPEAAREAAAANLRGMATAMEEYRARFGEYASGLQSLLDNGFLPKPLFEGIVTKGAQEGYRYSLEKSAADSYLIRAQREDTLAAGTGALTVDQTGAVLEDGAPLPTQAEAPATDQ